MYIVRIKYTHQAIPTEYKFNTQKKAEQFCKDKEEHNPYVRWTEIESED